MLGLALLASFSALPPDLVKDLDTRYRGWRPAPIAPQISEWFREYRFAFAPNLLEADFNEDGRPDWALYIAAPDGKHLLVAAVSQGEGWSLHQLSSDAPDPFTYLLLQAKGERDFDFRTLRHFRHSRDSIALMYFSETPLRFVWKGGRFESGPLLNDEE